jgi:hypothetical protein
MATVELFTARLRLVSRGLSYIIWTVSRVLLVCRLFARSHCLRGAEQGTKQGLLLAS